MGSVGEREDSTSLATRGERQASSLRQEECVAPYGGRCEVSSVGSWRSRVWRWAATVDGQWATHHGWLVTVGAATEVDAGQSEQQRVKGKRHERWCERRSGGLVAREAGSGCGKQVAGVGEACVDVNGGEEAEVTDLDETVGKDVLEKAANELDRVARRGGMPAGAKDDARGVGVDEAGVRNGDAMGVATEVAVHLLRSAKGTLGVDDPTGVVQAPASATSGASLIGVTEVPAGLECGEAGEEFAAEERAEHMDGEEKGGRCRNPACAVEGESAAGDDAMDVRMKLEFAGPGVQDTGDRELRGVLEPLRVPGERVESGGGALDEQVVQARPIESDQAVQLARHGEDDVEILRGQDARHALLDPARLPQRLALGAMAVATRIVGGPREAARGAHLEMPAERSGATAHHVAGDALARWRRDVALAEGLEVVAEDVGHFESGTLDRSARPRSGTLHGTGSADRGSLRRADEVDRARHLPKLPGGQVEILRRRFQVRMAEQELHRAHIGAGFEQVRGEAVPQRVW